MLQFNEKARTTRFKRGRAGRVDDPQPPGQGQGRCTMLDPFKAMG
jgi:hypothetical protein